MSIGENNSNAAAMLDGTDKSVTGELHQDMSAERESTLYTRIRGLIPRMRRLGCMMMPCPRVADDAVRRCLLRVLDQQNELDPGDQLEATIFKLYLEELDQMDVSATSEKTEIRNPAQQKLLKLSHEERKVFLLRYVEEFSVEKTSMILELTGERVRVVERAMRQSLVYESARR